MTQLLNIKWFQEQDSKKSPKTQIHKHCMDNGIYYHECEIPGDTSIDKDTDSVFTMDTWKNEIKDKIIDILDKDDEKLTVSAYSLAARPTIDAINELCEEYQARIKLTLIRPAYNPLHAIKVLDWKKTPEFITLQNDDYYLKWNPEKVFNALISGWKWYDDWKGEWVQFQKDLQEYVRRWIFTYPKFQEYIENLWFSAKIVGGKIEEDRVIHDLKNQTYSREKRWTDKALMSHLPLLSKEDLEEFIS